MTEAQILFDQWCGTEVSKKVVCWDRWNFNAKSSQKCPIVHYEPFINSFAQSFHNRRNSAVHERLLPKFFLLKMCFPISIVAAFPWNYFVSFFPLHWCLGCHENFDCSYTLILWILYPQAYSRLLMFFYWPPLVHYQKENLTRGIIRWRFHGGGTTKKVSKMFHIFHLLRWFRGHRSIFQKWKSSESKRTIDLSNGKFFTTMEWLMVFVKVPL